MRATRTGPAFLADALIGDAGGLKSRLSTPSRTAVKGFMIALVSRERLDSRLDSLELTLKRRRTSST